MEERKQDGEVPQYGTKYTVKHTPGRVLARGCIILIDYMDPTPIVDIMQQEEFLKFSDCRDINELPLTTEKNRAIIYQINRRREEGYTNFKRFLTLTKQTTLVDYLESIEEGKDTTAVIEALRKGKGITNHWKCVKDELVALYQEYYVKTELSPLTPGSEIHVDDLYVPLQMEEASASHFPFDVDLERKQRKEVKCFQDLLCDEYQLVNNVFVVADPGVGKTTFCRKLTSVWCKAHTDNYGHTHHTGRQTESNDDDDNVEADNVETMKLFDFLFFVSLRHTSNESKIEDMITNQLKVDRKVLESIVSSTEIKCLIILDGLDEWSVPLGTTYSPSEIKGFPKIENVSKCHILVTTRPWKLLSLSQLGTYRHKEVNVVEMKIDNSKRLVRLFLNQIRKNSPPKKLEQLSRKFLSEMKEKDLYELSASPLVLKLLLCLWLENGKLRKSVCQIYGAVIDLLIEHGLNRNKEDNSFSSKMGQIVLKPKPLANCFNHSDFDKLNRFSDILLQLAKLSFDTLFSGKDNSKLIFRDRDLKLYDLDLELCSKLGILSQRPVIGKSLLYRERTVAFLHKSLQEFYAALYISHNPEECMDHIRVICNNHNKLFEMSNVFQFVGGISPSIISNIFDHIRYIDDNLDDSNSETDHIRDMFSKIILSIANEILIFDYKTLLIKMNYLCASENTVSKFLDYVYTKKLKGISLRNVDFSHSQVRRLLTCSPNLRKVNLSNVKIHADSNCECLLATTGMQITDDESTVEIVTVNGDLNMYPHMQRYRSLQELHLSSSCELMHIQIAYLLSDSAVLRVVNMSNISCKEDQYCGCQEQTVSCSNDQTVSCSMSVFSRICRCFTNERPQHARVSVMKNAPLSVISHVETLKIEYGGGVLKHIYHYPRIQEITLITIKLTHTDMYHLLTDSRNLRKIKLKDINCAADDTCSCLQSHRIHVPSIPSTSYMKACDIVLGSDVFKHINSYARLQDISIVSINLDHLEITTLLTKSPCLNKVKLRNVACNAVQKCGCQKSGFPNSERTDRDDGRSHLYIAGANCSVSVCTLIEVSGVFNHVRVFPDLYELDIGVTDLTHTEVTSLLTSSSNLRKVRFDEVNCKPDRECGCPTDMHHRACSAETCTIEGGSEMFAHIDNYPKLKDLKLHYVQLSCQKLTHILSKSPNLEKVSLAGIELLIDIKHGNEYTSSEILKYDKPVQTQISSVLGQLPRREGLLVIVNDIELSSGVTDTLAREVELLEKFEILEYIELKEIKSNPIHDERQQRFTLKLKIK